MSDFSRREPPTVTAFRRLLGLNSLETQILDGVASVLESRKLYDDARVFDLVFRERRRQGATTNGKLERLAKIAVALPDGSLVVEVGDVREVEGLVRSLARPGIPSPKIRNSRGLIG